mgnify:CR=1 FL=1
MQNMDWDIFRFVMAVSDSGSAVAAAKKLGVNPSTVLRRISKFEAENSVRLFERLQTGYAPTVECAAIVETARQIENSVAEIGRDIFGRDLRLEGKLTVTTTDSFLHAFLGPCLAEFSTLHPRIRIEVTVTNTRLNLTRHDADVAIRASRKPPDTLIGQRVSAVGFAVYGPPSLTAQLPAGRQLEDCRNLPWVGIGETLTGSPIGGWLDKNIPESSIVMTADTFSGIRDCAAAGGGFAVLPCCLGDQAAGLERITPPVTEMETSLWVLTHAGLRGAARVKAFTDFVVRALRSHRGALEGTAAQPD